MTHAEAMQLPLGRELYEHVQRLRGKSCSIEHVFQSDWSALAVELFVLLPVDAEVERHDGKTYVSCAAWANAGVHVVTGTDAAAFCLAVVRAYLMFRNTNPHTESEAGDGRE